MNRTRSRDRRTSESSLSLKRSRSPACLGERKVRFDSLLVGLMNEPSLGKVPLALRVLGGEKMTALGM